MAKPALRETQARFSSESESSESDDVGPPRPYKRPNQQPSPEPSDDVLIHAPSSYNHESAAIINSSNAQRVSAHAAESPLHSRAGPVASAHDMPHSQLASKASASQHKPVSALFKQHKPRSPARGFQSLFKKPSKGSGLGPRPSASFDCSAVVSITDGDSSPPQLAGADALPDTASQDLSRSVLSANRSDSHSQGHGRRGLAQRQAWSEQEARATRDVLQAHGKDWRLLQVRL